MKIVIAPDSFKESASSCEIASWVEKGIHSIIPDCETVKVPIGDGGEGTLDALLNSGFTPFTYEVMGPVGNLVHARLGIKQKTALIELAECSGLRQLPDGVRAPLTATTYGVGQLILHALNHRVDTIILAVGGSATTDCGAGALQALGASLTDISGKEIDRGGQSLIHCESIDLARLDSRIKDVRFILATDVQNPLLGTDGAAAIFSPQKGATPEQVEILERSLSHFAVLSGSANVDSPGSGSAGGFGFFAMTFLDAQVQSGIEMVLAAVNFDEILRGANAVITGEGRFDLQSARGKAPYGILHQAQRNGVPTYLICGSAQKPISDATGFADIVTLNSIEPDIARCISAPEPLVTKLAMRIAESLQ